MDLIDRFIHLIEVSVPCCWPLLLLIVAYWFREQIGGLLLDLSGRIKKATLSGVEVEFFDSLIEEVEPGREAETLIIGIQEIVINCLARPYCLYLFEVANKGMSWREHARTLGKVWPLLESLDPNVWMGTLAGILQFAGLLFESSTEDLESGDFMLTLEVSPEVLELLVKRIHPEMETGGA